MTFNNSVLIILKQSTGIEYNDLLARMSPRYKNTPSANAALNRSIKNLTSFGLVKKEGTRLFITDKGLASISIEMKEKLVLKLNEAMLRPLTNLEDIVRLLLVLSQRSAQDTDLLNNAKQNASFTIHDIELVQKKIRERRKFLRKMSELLESQQKRLRELDFNDSVELPFDNVLVAKISQYCADKKVVVELRNEEIFLKIPDAWKKQSNITVEKDSLDLLLQLLVNTPAVKANLYLPSIKIFVLAGKATCFASATALKQFLDIKVAVEAIAPPQAPLNPDTLSTLLPLAGEGK